MQYGQESNRRLHAGRDGRFLLLDQERGEYAEARVGEIAHGREQDQTVIEGVHMRVLVVVQHGRVNEATPDGEQRHDEKYQLRRVCDGD